MPTTLSYRLATPLDTSDIINLELRSCDYREALDGADCGDDIKGALAMCLEVSRVTYVVERGREIVAVFGLGATDEGIHPWLLSTAFIFEDNPLVSCRLAKDFVFQLRQDYPNLEIYNYVWTYNTTAIQWLKWLGFIFADVPTHKIGPRDYIRFALPKQLDQKEVP